MSKMDAERLDVEKTLGALTLEEKLRMLTGDDMWHTFGAAELPRVRTSDGPCGLRMTDGGAAALPATLFPSPSMLANSWDPALLYDVGAAIGAEATAVGVNLLLAPGLNIKRSPLCGRNFEYFSEDPYLSGTLGKAFVSGVQSTGVGACVKHFAANNTETLRMYSDSVVDARALHEIYLRPFEIALEAEPAAVMCAYNKLNGEYCSQNEYLLKTVLRDKFGYKGVTISDWGAVRDRAAALAAGLDLEMPYNAFSYDDLAYAVDSGDITEADVDGALKRLLALIDDVYLEPYGDFDADAHDKLAYFAAASSVVMLKNDGGFLPLTKDMKIAVVGEYAECAPLQGGGSSHVTPLRTVSPLEAFTHRDIDISYYRGYSPDPKENAALSEEARRGAADADAVIVYVGLPAPQEGADRKDTELPPEQNALVSALVADGRRVAVVLVTPGAVSMPWVKRVRSVLYQGLCGANGALAAADVLFGRVNPRGRLAESFSCDIPTAARCGGLVVPYTESIFVGYRKHDRTGNRPIFPFGHGLSFSEISYDGMRVKRIGGDTFDVTVTLTNKSTRDAYETVQVYVSDRTGRVMRPEKQLAGYCKVFIEGETTVETTVRIDRRAFEFWNAQADAFSVPDGEYKIIVAASAEDIRAETTVKVDGDFKDKQGTPARYSGDLKDLTDDDLTSLGVTIPETRRPVKGEHTLDSSLSDVGRTVGGRIAVRAVKRRAALLPPEEREAFLASALETPLSAVTSMSGGAVTPEVALGLVEMANGRFFAGLKLLLKRNKER